MRGYDAVRPENDGWAALALSIIRGVTPEEAYEILFDDENSGGVQIESPLEGWLKMYFTGRLDDELNTLKASLHLSPDVYKSSFPRRQALLSGVRGSGPATPDLIGRHLSKEEDSRDRLDEAISSLEKIKEAIEWALDVLPDDVIATQQDIRLLSMLYQGYSKKQIVIEMGLRESYVLERKKKLLGLIRSLIGDDLAI